MTIPSKRPPAARVTIACPDRFTVATVFFLFFLRFEPQIDYLCPSKSNAMDQTDLQPLYDNYHRKIAKIDLRFKRYLYRQINWKTRIISIRGPRGVGKTTMLLQHILENYEDIDQTLYVSLDDLWFATHNLMDLVL